MELKTTTEYSRFKIYDFNRPVDKNRIGVLAESMVEHGFLLPILVGPGFFVLDGQHRLEAAKISKVAISYIKISIPIKKIPLLIAGVNSTARNWGNEDYLNLWVQQGIEHYTYIRNVLVNYKLNLPIFFRIVGDHREYRKNFKNGELNISGPERKRITRRAIMINGICQVYIDTPSISNSLAFKRACCSVVVKPEYNHKIMLAKLEKNPGKVKKVSNSRDYVFMLADIYNHGSRNKIDFTK